MNSKDSQKAILVVDDDSRHLELMDAKLSEKGYKVIKADSGEKALETIEAEKPGLVLLDAIIPWMNGFEVLKKIKSNYPELPVAMVSVIWDKDEYKKYIEAGACEYITKPVDFERLESDVLLKFLGNGKKKAE